MKLSFKQSSRPIVRVYPRCMGKRGRKRQASAAGPAAAKVPPVEYLDADGNRLVLRGELKVGALERVRGNRLKDAANSEDIWQRQTELLFELLAVEWVIYDLPITKSKELLARYRMADADTRTWVRATIDEHVASIDR